MYPSFSNIIKRNMHKLSSKSLSHADVDYIKPFTMQLRLGFFLDRDGRFLVVFSACCLEGGTGDTLGVTSEEEVPDME